MRGTRDTRACTGGHIAHEHVYAGIYTVFTRGRGNERADTGDRRGAATVLARAPRPRRLCESVGWGRDRGRAADYIPSRSAPPRAKLGPTVRARHADSATRASPLAVNRPEKRVAEKVPQMERIRFLYLGACMTEPVQIIR